MTREEAINKYKEQEELCRDNYAAQMEEINLVTEVRKRLAEIRNTANYLIHYQSVSLLMMAGIRDRVDEILALMDYIEEDLKEE